MASPLPSQESEPTFLDFFGMTRAPFCRLEAASEIFYSDQCSLLNSHLTDATERADSLIVVCGADGSGKTTLLNQYIAGLGEDLCYAAFDETCVESAQFYCSFLKQIGFDEISGTLRELQRITREFLIHRGKNGKHVLFFMDNAQLVRPAVLEQLRWIAEIKNDDERVLSMVLAGNPKLPRIMDSPAMSSLKFRYQTNFHIRVYSERETDDYVRHRLSLAGAADAARFSDESRALIYRFTGGIPRMINMLCNAVLAESCAQGTRVISEQLIRSVADAHRILPHVVPIKGKGRRKADTGLSLLMPDSNASEFITGQQPRTTLANRESLQAPARHDAEINELLVRIAELSSQAEGANEENRLALAEAEKHDKKLGEVRTQLAAQIEGAETLTRALDDKARDIGQLNAAISVSEKLRQDAEVAGKALAGDIEELRGKLEARNREVEDLAARQKKNDEKIDQLTETLAESKLTLAERGKTVEALAASLGKWETANSGEVMTELRAQLVAQAAELDALFATVASSTAELSKLKETLADSKNALLQSEESSKAVIADFKKERRLTKRANTALGKTNERLEVLARNNSKLQISIAELNADLEGSARKAGKIDALEKSLEAAREEYATLRSRLEALESLEKLIAEKDGRIAELEADLESHNVELTDTETLLPQKKTAFESRKQKCVVADGDPATIELFLDGKPLKVMDLGGGPSRMMIGRAQDCEIRLNSKFVSRHHAFIICTEDGVTIEDLHSSNGVFVNSEKVAHAVLRSGDTVGIGNFWLRLKRG